MKKVAHIDKEVLINIWPPISQLDLAAQRKTVLKDFYLGNNTEMHKK